MSVNEVTVCSSFIEKINGGRGFAVSQKKTLMPGKTGEEDEGTTG